MTYVPVPLPEGTETLSHSRRNDYNVCPRLYFYKYELGLKVIDTPAPLRMGGIMSDALEHKDPELAQQAYAELIAEAAGDQRQDLLDVLLDEQAVVVAAATEKLKRPEMHADTLEPEVVFVGQVANGFVDNGRFDGIDQSGDHVLIIERKFKTYFSANWAEELTMDDQLTSYIANAMLKYGVPLEQVLVQFEVAWKPRVRRGKAETPEAFRLRKAMVLMVKHDDHHTIILPGDRVLQRNAQQLSDWWDRFVRMTEDLLRERELAKEGEVEAWPQRTHSCFRFNKPCEFIGLCTAATPAAFQGEVTTKFTTRAQRAETRRLLDVVADET